MHMKSMNHIKKIILLSFLFSATANAGFWSFLGTPFSEFFNAHKKATLIVASLVACVSGVALYKYFFGFNKHDSMPQPKEDEDNRYDELLEEFNNTSSNEYIKPQY